jgi:hypothetical protein
MAYKLRIWDFQIGQIQREAIRYSIKGLKEGELQNLKWQLPVLFSLIFFWYYPIGIFE